MLYYLMRVIMYTREPNPSQEHISRSYTSGHPESPFLRIICSALVHVPDLSLEDLTTNLWYQATMTQVLNISKYLIKPAFSPCVFLVNSNIAISSSSSY